MGLNLSCCSTLRFLLAGVAVLIMSPCLPTFLPRSHSWKMIPLPALLLGVFWQRPLSPALCPNWSRYVTPWRVPLPRMLRYSNTLKRIASSCLACPNPLICSSPRVRDWMVPVRVHLRICALRCCPLALGGPSYGFSAVCSWMPLLPIRGSATILNQGL